MVASASGVVMAAASANTASNDLHTLPVMGLWAPYLKQSLLDLEPKDKQEPYLNISTRYFIVLWSDQDLRTIDCKKYQHAVLSALLTAAMQFRRLEKNRRNSSFI